MAPSRFAGRRRLPSTRRRTRPRGDRRSRPGSPAAPKPARCWRGAAARTSRLRARRARTFSSRDGSASEIAGATLRAEIDRVADRDAEESRVCLLAIARGEEVAEAVDAAVLGVVLADAQPEH